MTHRGALQDAGVQLGFWELLEYIVMEGAPTLPRDQFSPEFCDFISKCLLKDAKSRPSVQELSRCGTVHQQNHSSSKSSEHLTNLTLSFTQACVSLPPQGRGQAYGSPPQGQADRPFYPRICGGID